MKEPHVHAFKPTETVVPLRNVVKEHGKVIRNLIVGRDTLQQRKCKCGKVETYDLIRKVTA